MKRTNIAAVIGAAVLITAGSVLGQVVQLQQGNALDANNQIGSGGYNTVIGGTGGVNSQLYIVGQVTGLSRFRGKVGYKAADQLRLTLPSAKLDLYDAQSVGLREATAGNTYRTTPYRNRNATVLSARGIASGYSMPGTNVPANPTQHETYSPVSKSLVKDVVKGYESVMPLVTPNTTLASGKTHLIRVSDIPVIPVNVAPGETMRAGADAFMGMANWEDRQKLAQALYEMGEEEQMQVESATGRQINAAIDTRIDAVREKSSAPGLTNEAVENLQSEPNNPNRTGESRDLTQGATAPYARQEDKDVYSSLLLRLQQKNTAEDAVVKEVEPTAGNDNRQLPNDKTASTDDAADVTGANSTEGHLVELDEGKNIVLHSFAGFGPDLFNRYMAAGERKMKQEKFYAALNDFQSAAYVNPKNPVAKVAMCMSYFGAGEIYSAALNLYQAMELFPPMMETRLDIDRMMYKATFEERLKKLDYLAKNVENNMNPYVYMLGAYLYANQGDELKAEYYAGKLIEAAKDDKLMHAYGIYILTGKRPGESEEKATTQPTVAK